MVGQNKYKKAVVIGLFMVPSLLGMIVFKLIPLMYSLFLSFSKWDMIGSIQFVGFSNYKTILHSTEFYNALFNTFEYIFGYLPLVLFTSLLIAVLLNQKIRGVTAFRALYFLPVITSWVAVSMIWLWMFNPEFGLVNFFLSLIGINGPAWVEDTNWAMPAIILTSVWKDTGFYMVIFLAGLQNIPRHYYEASEIDGATGVKKFLYITLPLLAPSIFFVLIISIINSFQVFDQVMIMTEGGPAGATSVLVEQIYKNAFSYYKMGIASALSWVLFAIIFIFTYVQNQLQKRWIDYEI